MFEVLTERITRAFQKLNSKGRLTERDVDESLREVRLALLEADVSLRVVKDFVTRIRERSLNIDALDALTPAQQIVRLVHEELIFLLGGASSHLIATSRLPSVVMLVGLQGSGKTTTAAKLGLHLRGTGQKPLLVAADMKRPAAAEQLMILGKELNIPVHSEQHSSNPLTVCDRAVKLAGELVSNWVVVDTQGRLHADDELMEELRLLKIELKPAEILLIVDAMTGQDAVRVAEEFQDKIGLSGAILTKMDGDARGGAALSIKSVTGVPIKFIGVGERSDALETFHPDRMASRILGMGDILSLAEKAERAFDEKKVKQLEEKLRSSKFDLEDLLGQLKEIKKMGPIGQLMEMIPGFAAVSKNVSGDEQENQIGKVEAIINSMTPEERHNPAIVDGSRRRRIARGSGTTPQDINQVLKQFRQVQKLVRFIPSGKLPKGMLGGILPHSG